MRSVLYFVASVAIAAQHGLMNLEVGTFKGWGGKVASKRRNYDGVFVALCGLQSSHSDLQPACSCWILKKEKKNPDHKDLHASKQMDT